MSIILICVPFHLSASLYNSYKFSVVHWPFLLFILQIPLTLYFPYLRNAAPARTSTACFWVLITVSQCNLTAQGYAAFPFLFHFFFSCRPGRGNFYLGSLASFNIDVTCPTISHMSETICQPQLALKICQHLLIHIKVFCLWWVVANFLKASQVII